MYNTETKGGDHINKFLPVAIGIAGLIIFGGIIANMALLNDRVRKLEKYPVKVIVPVTTTPTSSPSATLSPVRYKGVTPVISKTK